MSKLLALSTGLLSTGLLSTPMAFADDAKGSVDAILDSIVVPEPTTEPIVVAPTPEEKDMDIAPSDTVTQNCQTHSKLKSNLDISRILVILIHVR